MARVRIPLGCKFKFEPEDHELLVYLACKSAGVALPCEGLIEEVDLYGLTDPGILFKRNQEKVVYVFTKLKKVTKDGKRVERSVSGNRTWKGVDAAKPIHDAQGILVGEKKNFVLMNKMKMKLGYNMIEFSLIDEALKNSKFKDYVVCQIKKKVKKVRSLINNLPAQNISHSSVSKPTTEGDVMVYHGVKPIILGQSLINNLPAQNICHSSVSKPTTEGDVMAYRGVKPIILGQSQKDEESNQLSIFDMIDKLASAPYRQMAQFPSLD